MSQFTLYIKIDDWDILYDHLTDWASAHNMSKLSRELRAVTLDNAHVPHVDKTPGREHCVERYERFG